MDGRISKQQLKELLAEDVETMLEEVAGAMNQARPGSIIDDSEELVREAAGEFNSGSLVTMSRATVRALDYSDDVGSR